MTTGPAFSKINPNIKADKRQKAKEQVAENQRVEIPENGRTMKAVAVFPGKPDSVHLADLPVPSLNDIAGGRGALVRVLRVGGDGTDKEINANREYFEMGVGDMAQPEAEYPGWLNQLLTHPVKRLENYQELFEKLTTAKGAIKVYMEVAPL
jgi:hypothetical protein